MTDFKPGDKVILDADRTYSQRGVVVDPTTPTTTHVPADTTRCVKVRVDSGGRVTWWHTSRMSHVPTVELSEEDRKLLLKALADDADLPDIVAARRLLTPTRTQTFTVTFEMPDTYTNPLTEELVATAIAESMADDVHVTATEIEEKD